MRNVFVGVALGLLIPACAQDPEPEQADQVSDGQEEGNGDDGSGKVDDVPVHRPISVVLTHDPGDCADNSVFLYANVIYLDDGSLVEAGTCLFEFEDGTQAAGCFVAHPAPMLQNVVVTATDPATGATATASDRVQGPASFTSTLDVTTSELTLSWDAHNLYGDVLDVGGVIVSIEPSANVIETDPALFRQFQGTVNVTTPGTYTVHLNGFITFGDAGGCGAFVDKTIEVCHEGDHEHHLH